MCALVTTMLTCFGLSLAAIIIFYYFFTGDYSGQCKLHEFFISFNMLLCIAFSIVSILPQVQEHMPNSGLLQSGLITLYIMYLTWSSMSSNPDATCNPMLSYNGTDLGPENTDHKDPHPMDSTSIIGLVIWFLCVLYSSIKTASNSSAAKLAGGNNLLTQDNGASGGGGDAENGGQQVWDNEEDDVAYNWCLFHIMFALATLYAMMTLTNWFE